MKRWYIRSISSDTIRRVRVIQEQTDARLAEIVELCVHFGADQAHEYLSSQAEATDDLLSIVGEMKQLLLEVDNLLRQANFRQSCEAD
jgi:hypothetical protein